MLKLAKFCSSISKMKKIVLKSHIKDWEILKGLSPCGRVLWENCKAQMNTGTGESGASCTKNSLMSYLPNEYRKRAKWLNHFRIQYLLGNHENFMNV